MKNKARIINLIFLICVLIAVTCHSVWLLNQLNKDDDKEYSDIVYQRYFDAIDQNVSDSCLFDTVGHLDYLVRYVSEERTSKRNKE